jgi:hypothetical protein
MMPSNPHSEHKPAPYRARLLAWIRNEWQIGITLLTLLVGPKESSPEILFVVFVWSVVPPGLFYGLGWKERLQRLAAIGSSLSLGALLAVAVADPAQRVSVGVVSAVGCFVLLIVFEQVRRYERVTRERKCRSVTSKKIIIVKSYSQRAERDD